MGTALAEIFVAPPVDYNARYPMPPPANPRTAWRGVPVGNVIMEPLHLVMNDPHLAEYKAQPGRFLTVALGDVHPDGMVTFSEELTCTCATVYQAKRVCPGAPLTVILGVSPATNDTDMSTFDMCAAFGCQTWADSDVAASCCTLDAANSAYLSGVNPYDGGTTVPVLMSHSRMGPAAAVDETTRTIFMLGGEQMMTDFTPSSVSQSKPCFQISPRASFSRAAPVNDHLLLSDQRATSVPPLHGVCCRSIFCASALPTARAIATGPPSSSCATASSRVTWMSPCPSRCTRAGTSPTRSRAR